MTIYAYITYFIIKMQLETIYSTLHVVSRETKVTTPQKKVVEEEKVVQEVDEDSKTSENGDTKETKENGSSEEKESDEKEAESTENGDSTGKCCQIKQIHFLLFIFFALFKSRKK